MSAGRGSLRRCSGYAVSRCRTTCLYMYKDYIYIYIYIIDRYIYIYICMYKDGSIFLAH